MKILLLNPPGKKLYIRDYFCSKVSQANYIHQPIDLVIISGMLRSLNCDVFLVDAIVQGLSEDAALQRIIEIQPDFIISLAGAVSWNEDKEFFKRIKEKIRCKLIVCGDIFQENAQAYLDECEFIDGIIKDFTSPHLIDFIKSNSGEKGIISADSQTTFEIPMPSHELFLGLNYRYPFAQSGKFCTTLTQFGCPFKCSFCIMGELKYKHRTVINVMEELRYIKKIGVKEVFFIDQTFGLPKESSKDLIEQIIKEKLGISWFTFSRVDVADEALLKSMKQAGCHTIIFGVESGSDDILKKYRKGYNKQDIKRTLEFCSILGIKTVGTFIFGLPEETKETAQETLDFIKEIPLDYASFNVAVPRMGTELRKEASSLGLIKDDLKIMDQSGSDIAMNTKYLSQNEVMAVRQMAVRQFYLRPSYLLKRVKKIRTFYEFKHNLLDAWQLMRNTWKF